MEFKRDTHHAQAKTHVSPVAVQRRRRVELTSRTGDKDRVRDAITPIPIAATTRLLIHANGWASVHADVAQPHSPGTPSGNIGLISQITPTAVVSVIATKTRVVRSRVTAIGALAHVKSRKNWEGGSRPHHPAVMLPPGTRDGCGHGFLRCETPGFLESGDRSEYASRLAVEGKKPGFYN